MKRAVILAGLAFLLIPTASYAPCFYPHSHHYDYYQHHAICAHDPCRSFDMYEEWWSLDGTCDIDCDGNEYCSGDTHVDSFTFIDHSMGPCDPICD